MRKMIGDAQKWQYFMQMRVSSKAVQYYSGTSSVLFIAVMEKRS